MRQGSSSKVLCRGEVRGLPEAEEMPARRWRPREGFSLCGRSRGREQVRAQVRLRAVQSDVLARPCSDKAHLL